MHLEFSLPVDQLKSHKHNRIAKCAQCSMTQSHSLTRMHTCTSVLSFFQPNKILKTVNLWNDNARMNEWIYACNENVFCCLYENDQFNCAINTIQQTRTQPIHQSNRKMTIKYLCQCVCVGIVWCLHIYHVRNFAGQNNHVIRTFGEVPFVFCLCLRPFSVLFSGNVSISVFNWNACFVAVHLLF